MNKTRIKTIIGIVLALVLVLLLTSQIFWGNTPRFHPLLWSRIKSFPNKVISLPGEVISLLPIPFKKETVLDDGSQATSLFGIRFKKTTPKEKKETVLDDALKATPTIAEPKEITDLGDIPAVTPPSGVEFKQVAPGVKRGTDTKTGTEYITYEAGTELEIVTYTLSDGSKVSVLVPKF